jgi:hypothetical protein
MRFHFLYFGRDERLKLRLRKPREFGPSVQPFADPIRAGNANQPRKVARTCAEIGSGVVVRAASAAEQYGSADDLAEAQHRARPL